MAQQLERISVSRFLFFFLAQQRWHLYRSILFCKFAESNNKIVEKRVSTENVNESVTALRLYALHPLQKYIGNFLSQFLFSHTIMQQMNVS